MEHGDIESMNPLIYTHYITLEAGCKLIRQMQQCLNPAMRKVVKVEVLKLLDEGNIYLITDSKWVNPTKVVPKKSGVTIIKIRMERWYPLILL